MYSPSQHFSQSQRRALCGCYFPNSTVQWNQPIQYFPIVQVNAHATILGSTSRTTLTQTFTNPNTSPSLKEAKYDFPLYDGVSVVGFTCTVGSRVIKGVVKERQEAKKIYDHAVAQGETAGLLQQSLSSSDVFTTSLGNVAAGQTVLVEITYLGELRHDAEVDGLRFTIPTSIAPRYGQDLFGGDNGGYQKGTISITVDADMAGCSAIKSIRSPSHPISVSIGTTSVSPDAEPSLAKGSATMSLSSTALGSDFVVQIVANGLGEPSAVLETHPTIPNQRALMTTLVPRFNLPTERPEIVFICDRSGSMGMDNKMPNLISALEILLKSLPLGVMFNICSFGSSYSFLWPESKMYDETTLDQAVQHIKSFWANFGGTQMHAPVQDTFKRRRKDTNLEVFLLTDGEIMDQVGLFGLINKHVEDSKGAIRVFTLGMGSQASHALIEGAARAGNGFAQTVLDHEKMEKKIIRMLKGALTPHITDYSLEIKYEASEESDDDFELVEKVLGSLEINTTDQIEPVTTQAAKKPISLFDKGVDNEEMEGIEHSDLDSLLPPVKSPSYLQTPFTIPQLFPFNRTTVYVLLSETAPEKRPKSVLLKGTSPYGPLELEIPITHLEEKGVTIHQLAARKVVGELEEGRGWLHHATDTNGKLLKVQNTKASHPVSRWFEPVVKREAVKLGVKYQVGGKWCSFVAVEQNTEHENGQVSDGANQSFEHSQAHNVAAQQQQMTIQQQQMAVQQQHMAAQQQQMAVQRQHVSAMQSQPQHRAAQAQILAQQQQQQQQQQGSTAPGFIHQNRSAFEPQTQSTGFANPLALSSGVVPSSPTLSFGSSFGTSHSARPFGSEPNPSRGLFGASGLNPISFGSSSNPPPPPGTAFGSPVSNPFQSTGGGLFGGSGSTSSGFGSSSNPPLPPGGLFCNSTSNYGQQSISLFGNVKSNYGQQPSSAFGAKTQGQSQQMQHVQQIQLQRMQQIQLQQMRQSDQIQQSPQMQQMHNQGESGSIQDYQAQLLLLESSGKKRLMMARVEVDTDQRLQDSSPKQRKRVSDVEATSKPDSLLHSFASLQTFAGNWAWSHKLEQILGITQQRATQLEISGNISNKDNILATLCVVVCLKQKLADDKDTWELLVDKAEAWLTEQTTGSGSTMDELQQIVREGLFVGI